MRPARLFLFLLLFSESCVEKLEVPVIYNSPALVVDGSISDQPGPYTVKLYLSAALYDDLDDVDYVAGAEVSILEGSGNIENLLEVSKGVYQTHNGYQGQIGNEYQLRIKTAEGRSYESDLLEMYPAGEIKGLSIEFKENSINQNDLTKPQDAVDVYLDGEGVAGSKNLLRWRWRGTYQTLTHPELRTKIVDGGRRIPDPFPCSGYIERNGSLFYVRPCECCDCWPTEYSPGAQVSDNTVVNRGTFSRIFLARIPVEPWRFYDKYYFHAEQLSVTEDVHNFWKRVQAQQQDASNLFQPNVVQVKGNIKSLTDPKEVVQGIFSVSAVASASVFISRRDIPIFVPEIPTIIADCRNYFDNSSNQKPPFW